MAQYQNNKIPQHVIGNSNLLPQSYANKSQFDLTEDLKTTIKFDYLYPVYWEQLNPGDKFEVGVKSLVRLMPMVAPTMDNIRLKYFAFFVPNRLLWKNWTKFMGEKIYQEDTNDYVVPQVSMYTINNAVGGLADYMGVVPLKTSLNFSVNALPFRAYNKIWNEWFRANELQAPLLESSDDNSDYNGYTSADDPSKRMYQLRKKGKPLDYFTSCLPYPQSGEPVMIPLTGDTPVKAGTGDLILGLKNNGNVKSATAIRIDTTSGNLTGNYVDGQPNDTSLYADMASVTGVSIQMLRKASALQVLLEKDARAGESYIDLMNAHYGVTVPDFLVGRSQYLGSSTTMINVEPIANTAGTTSTSPQGNLAGVGIGVNGDNLCEISTVEHGIFMILACADADVSYQQGLPRKFNVQSRYDYMFPEFHNLGDQAVFNREIFLSTDKELNDKVFGYQERYRELRESTNKVSGLMRSGVDGSLDVWHLAQKFNNTPTLSNEFIESNTPIDRVMAMPEEDQIILNVNFDVKALRTLPVTSNPSILAGRV